MMSQCKKDVTPCISNGVASFLHQPIELSLHDPLTGCQIIAVEALYSVCQE